jgi:hypothetical protein
MPGASARVCNAHFPSLFEWKCLAGATLRSTPSQNGLGKWARQTVAARLESGEMPLCDWNYERGDGTPEWIRTTDLLLRREFPSHSGVATYWYHLHEVASFQTLPWTWRVCASNGEQRFYAWGGHKSGHSRFLPKQSAGPPSHLGKSSTDGTYKTYKTLPAASIDPLLSHWYGFQARVPLRLRDDRAPRLRESSHKLGIVVKKRVAGGLVS